VRVRIEQHLVFVLAVEIDKWRSELAQCARRGERPIHERAAAAALRCDLASHDQFRSILPFKNRFDRRGIFAGSHKVAGCTAAGQQSNGPHEDGFAGTRLTREYAQTRFEFELEAIDHREIADAEEP